jgi:hypothetical protein
MGNRLIVPVLTAVALAAAVSGAHAARQVQKIAVAAFHAPDASRARSAVLATLSEHSDVEVVALEDIAFAAKRIGADPTLPAGRLKLSEELGVEAWLDGTIEDGSARFTLHSPEGRVLATASIQGHKANVAEGLAGPKVWEVMGPLLSVRERGKRALETQQELAMKKVQAREQELVRQRQVVEARSVARVSQLKAAQVLARDKRAAFVAELERQETIVSQKTAAAAREQKETERKQHEAEEAEFMASLNESSGPPPPAVAAPAGPAAVAGSSVWTAPAAPSSAWTGATGKNSGFAAASTAKVPAQSGPGLSPTTQSWLMAQDGSASPPAPAPRYAPAPAAPPVASQDGLSPATRAWLAQQGMH